LAKQLQGVSLTFHWSFGSCPCSFTLLLLFLACWVILQGQQAQEIMREGKMVPGCMIIGEQGYCRAVERAL
jgi:hypothetical protein